MPRHIRIDRTLEKARRMGAKAFLAGKPERANPYSGSGAPISWRRWMVAWRDGWQTAARNFTVMPRLY